MPFKNIHLLYSISHSAEKEYIKKFLRLIGCQVYCCPVDELDPLGWERALAGMREPATVFVAMNCGEALEVYEEGVRRNGGQLIRFTFDIKKRLYGAGHDGHQVPVPRGDAPIYYNAMHTLIHEIWNGDGAGAVIIRDIYEQYVGPRYDDDLFYLMQAKRCFRVVNMGEVLQYEEAKVEHVALSKYVKKMLRRLSDMYVGLKEMEYNNYRQYTALNAAITMLEIGNLLYRRDWDDLLIGMMPLAEVVDAGLAALLEQAPSIPVMLLCTRLYALYPSWNKQEEAMYQRILRLVPRDRPDHSYVWYRIGHYYEKEKGDWTKGLEYYSHAARVNPDLYQAVFKLGYYFATEGRFGEAERKLNEVINCLFHGRDMGPDPNDTYPNWSFLSLKELQYIYKAYILLAKMSIKNGREYSAKASIGRVCLAASKFEDAILERTLAGDDRTLWNEFSEYHMYSDPVWCMWKVLDPWGDIVKDDFVRHIVRGRLNWWKGSAPR